MQVTYLVTCDWLLIVFMTCRKFNFLNCDPYDNLANVGYSVMWFKLTITMSTYRIASGNWLQINFGKSRCGFSLIIKSVPVYHTICHNHIQCQ